MKSTHDPYDGNTSYGRGFFYHEKHGSGMVIVNPIPEKYEMDPDKIDKATLKAVAESRKKNIEGREVTPFLLARIAELTGNASLDSNIALVYNNVCLAAKVAATMNAQQSEGNEADGE